MNNAVVLPPIKIGKKFVDDLDELVEEGYFRSRSEAVRDAVKIMVMDFKKSRETIDEAVKAVREVREKMWQDALKDAKGDKDKARVIYAKKHG